MNNIKTVNLGLNPLNSRCQNKKIAWPVYAWKCILPVEVSRDIDILQKLILDISKVGNIDLHFLVEKLGFSIDLLKAVKEKCIEDGYLSSQGELTEIGMKKISDNNLFASDFNNAAKLEKVYLFRDALSGDVIPNFSIVNIPRWRKNSQDMVVLPYNEVYTKRPSMFDINNGLKTLSKLRKSRSDQQKSYSSENVEISEYEFDIDEIEVEWTSVNDHGDIEKKMEINAPDYKNTVSKSKLSNIKIWDNNPELIYVDSYIFVDPDKPNEWGVRSPFGSHEDLWFTRRLRAETYKNLELKEEVDILVEIAKDELSKKYALDNRLNIKLFDQFPQIANDPKFRYLKDEIESVKRVELRIKDGDKDYDTLFLRCQKALECLFGLCISKIENRFDLLKYINKDDFRFQIGSISEELGINVPENYTSSHICKSLFYVPKLKSGSIKDRALFLLYDAYYNKDSISIYILKTMPEFFQYINLIANNRNNTSHFNHVSKEETDFGKEVEQVLYCFEALIVILFSHYFRGE